MIIIHVIYQTKAGERDAFVKALLDENIPACTQKEDGNICYDFLLPIEEPDKVHLIEKWENAVCLDAHSKQPNYHRLGELRAKLGVEREAFNIYDVQSRIN